LGAGLDAKPGDFAQHLAVPLRELEGRHVCGDLDRRVFGKNLLQKADPGLADAGLAVGQAQQIGPSRFGESAEHGFGVRQRDAADKVDDRMFSAVGCHCALPGGDAFASS
jgi:hypothetical protein